MNRTKQKRVSERDALAMLFSVWQRHGMNRFNQGDYPPVKRAALDECRRRDWIWYATPMDARLTWAGVQALEPYGVRAEKAVGGC
jgi:hypothetical protein